MQRSVENRLQRRGLQKIYNDQFEKMIERCTLSAVSQHEIENWPGAVNYVTHHGVENPASNSTPLRIVSNSALVNNICGKSLNQILMKGPNCLNSLIKVLLKFRSYEIALLYDLSKAYQHLHTGPVEKYTRLVVWRDCDSSAVWRTYGFDCTAFGDIPAAVQLEVGKRLCAEAGVDIDEEASERIIRDTYVDDGATGGSTGQVERFRGKKDKDEKYGGPWRAGSQGHDGVWRGGC